MKLYQPVLFVGLGGTGCDIGTVVERRLREEICGPDGTEFRARRSNAEMLVHQLPSCVQFVYADMNQAELDRMPRRVVPGSQHTAAAERTAHYVRDLVPHVNSYQELALNLRLAAKEETASWLPPERGEPRISPLQRGAAQLPTVGRAGLFGTFLGGIEPAVRNLRDAIGNLATSGADLIALGGQPPRAVDVFVAFSVAGGTGCGIFYDYLHLIGHVFRSSRLQAKIYPLVLMPSAFPQGGGGGRPANLNAARSLLDLFRLVDHQNAGAARQILGHHDDGPHGRDRQAVQYPGLAEISLVPGTVQTGFLFSQPVGADRHDLHRSIASLVLSLIGTELEQETDHTGEPHQSFTDWWVNAGNNRQSPAENGIGNRGVSSALVASLTVPFDDLAGIIGGRLMRTAIEQLSTPVGKPESNRGHIEEFLRAAGVHPLFVRLGEHFTEPDSADGAKEIAAAISQRGDMMKAGLGALQSRLGREMPKLVSGFDPRAAIRELLGRLDPFHVQRVGFGHSDLADEYDKTGAAGLLRRRQAAPPAPPGISMIPPTSSEFRDRMFGLKKVRWADPVPVALRKQQELWYRWRTDVAWSVPWAAHAAQWQRTLRDTEAELGRLTRELIAFARTDEDRFARRAAELYRKRVGVSYLLPPGGAGMERYYEVVIRRMIEDLVADGQLQPAATEADLVHALLGADGWRQAYETTLEQGAEQAMGDLRDRVKARVKTFLRDTEGGKRPLLPRLHDLLSDAAGPPGGPLQDYVDEFRGKLAELVPATFTPQGNGPMKVLISYPADAADATVERYLRAAINVPPEPNIVYEMKNTHAESISVVLFRTSMGITEVDEVRDVLRLWASALARPEPSDFLRWRQRTGYQFGYLATTEEHRVEIAHRLLCAMWNGAVRADGNPESPDRVHVELGGGVTMVLALTPLERASSWGSLLRAYEQWNLQEGDTHHMFAMQLMRQLPDGLEGSYRDPHELFVTVCDIGDKEIARLDGMIAELPAGGRGRAEQMRQFWAETLPASLDRDFTGLESPARANLRLLLKAAEQRDNG